MGRSRRVRLQQLRPQPQVLPVLQKSLQDHHRRHLVDDALALVPPLHRRPRPDPLEVSLRLAGRQALIMEVHRHRHKLPQQRRKRLHPPRLFAPPPIQQQRVPHHQLGHPVLAHQPPHPLRVQPAALAFHGEQRLHRHPQSVRHRNADPSLTHIKRHQPRRRRTCLPSSSHPVHRPNLRLAAVYRPPHRHLSPASPLPSYNRGVSPSPRLSRDTPRPRRRPANSPSPRRRHPILRLTLFLAFLLVALALWLLLAPFGPATERLVDLPSGTSSFEIASLLQGNGIIRSRLAFDLLRLVARRRLRAGEYRFDHPASAVEVYRRIVHGDVFTHTVVIPEGFNIFDIAHAVEAAGLLPAAEMLDAEKSDTALIADLVPPGTHPTSLEGFLFPDTYRFARHTSANVMLGAMVRRFRQQSALLSLSPGVDLLHTLTLASLVEKEVAQPEERPLVASVFANRLRAGMPLQTDPTVVYAALLDNRFRGTIFASDLHAPSAWNTYTHPGLPPGPICNPGLRSLQAVLHPPPSTYLFFVSDAAGHTRFSSTLAEHNLHVAEYRHTRAALIP